jgi:hypothetical protein
MTKSTRDGVFLIPGNEVDVWKKKRSRKKSGLEIQRFMLQQSFPVRSSYSIL